MSSPSPCMKKKIMNHNKTTQVPKRSFTSVQMVHTHTHKSDNIGTHPSNHSVKHPNRVNDDMFMTQKEHTFAMIPSQIVWPSFHAEVNFECTGAPTAFQWGLHNPNQQLVFAVMAKMVGLYIMYVCMYVYIYMYYSYVYI